MVTLLRVVAVLHTLYSELAFRLDPEGDAKDLRGTTVVTGKNMSFAFNLVEYFHKETDILEKHEIA